MQVKGRDLRRMKKYMSAWHTSYCDCNITVMIATRMPSNLVCSQMSQSAADAKRMHHMTLGLQRMQRMQRMRKRLHIVEASEWRTNRIVRQHGHRDLVLKEMHQRVLQPVSKGKNP